MTTRLPPFDKRVPDAILPALEKVLAAHEATVVPRTRTQPTTFAEIGLPLERSDTAIVALLHETGHCLHDIFTRVERPGISGINGFERDAVELPGQLMEDFAWDRDVLTGMSGHHETGAVIEAVRDEVAVIRPPEWHRFPHAFAHIFADGHASGCYSYLWAEVLSADGFGRFVDAGTVDRATGDAFRAEVPARGATRPGGAARAARAGVMADEHLWRAEAIRRIEADRRGKDSMMIVGRRYLRAALDIMVRSHRALRVLANALRLQCRKSQGHNRPVETPTPCPAFPIVCRCQNPVSDRTMLRRSGPRAP